MSDIEGQPYEQTLRAFDAMEWLHAEEMTEQLRILCAPHSKQNYIDSIQKMYDRQASYYRESELKTMTPEELAYGIARKHIDGQ